MKRRLLVFFTAFLLLVSEGVFFSQLPYSLSSLLFLPIIYISERQQRLGWFLVLVLYESMFERMPLLAGLSMIVMIEALLELLEGEFNIHSLAFSLAVLPGIDLARQFWTAIFVALYNLPTPPPIQPLQLLFGAILGLLYHWFIDPKWSIQQRKTWA